MNRLKAIIAVGAYAGCHALVWLASGRLTAVVEELVAVFLPLVVGLLLAAVGIFLGSLGDLYSLIAAAGLDRDARVATAKAIGAIIEELRQNTVFSLCLLGTTILLRIFAQVDMPGLNWPIAALAFSKSNVFDALLLWLSFLMFYAIYDCVAAMFTLHRCYEEVLTSEP